MKIRTPLGLSLISTPSGMDFYEPGTRRGWETSCLRNKSLQRLLEYCGDGVERDSLIIFMKDLIGVSEDAAAIEIDQLCSSGLLVGAEHNEYAALQSEESAFVENGWEDALIYHWHTNLYPKLDYYDDPRDEKDQEMMRKNVEEGAPPENYKQYKNSKIISLNKKIEKISTNGASVLTEEFSRNTNTAVKDVNQLGAFLYFAYGQTFTRNMQVTGLHVAKTSPSGGSRHPTEVYPIILNIEGIESGIYHYNVEKHGLEEIELGSFLEFVRSNVLILDDHPSFDPTVVFIFSTIFERSMHRYRDPRSYRVMHNDIGHLMQTSAYLAKSFGNYYFGGYSLNDTKVDRKIGLDGIFESSMTFVAIG